MSTSKRKRLRIIGAVLLFMVGWLICDILFNPTSSIKSFLQGMEYAEKIMPPK